MNRERKLLKKLRAEKGLTQQELADKLGIKQAYLSQLETGSNNPTLRLAKKIELYFDTPMESIFPDMFHYLDIDDETA